MGNECEPVTVSRRVSAPAEKIFSYLADPRNHPTIDGSEMLRVAGVDRAVKGVGDTFEMSMHNDEMGDYVITNYVVEFDAGRRITWEPELTHASRDEDASAVGDRAGHRWGFELAPIDATTTMVTEVFDCSDAPDWLRTVLDNGKRWEAAMTLTLEKLDAEVAG